MRRLGYGLAINEATTQLMESDSRIVVIGQGLWSPWYIGNSMVQLEKKFGKERVIDSPVSESGVTGVGVGAALAGLYPIVVHPRMDFMILASDQIFNQAAMWHYMFGGAVNVPIVIRGIINRGGEQAAQHSQSLQSWYAHHPGLKVVMPATAYDAKGLFISAVRDPNPVIYIDDRWLYSSEDDVPEDMYEVPIGSGKVRRQGNDVTLVAISAMVPLAMEAATMAAEEGIDVEVIDPRSVRPLDEEMIIHSVRKTGRLVVAELAWRHCSISSEIIAICAERAFNHFRAPARRVTLPECPAPASRSLEQAYYPTARAILDALRETSKSR